MIWNGMKRMIFTVLIFSFLPFAVSAQSSNEIEKILLLSGVTSAEELTAEDFELLQDALRHPIRINLASKSRLISSGLFSPYQAVSLIDYRKRFGDVLSYAELAAVDGFGIHCVEMLKPFINLDTRGHDELSAPKVNSVYNELSLRGGYRYSAKEQDWHYGLKYGLDAGPFQVSIGGSRSRTAKTSAPTDYTGSLCYDFKKLDARVILGDYNARFGQGLLAWNGAFINSLRTPSSFMKKASGLTPVRSFTGSVANTGMTMEFGFKQTSLAAAYSFGGQKIVNFRRFGRVGTAGMTILNDGGWKSSLDAAVCIRGVNLFGETVYDWLGHSAAFVLGNDFSPADNLRIASLLGWYQRKQWQTAFSGTFLCGSRLRNSLTFASDFIYYLTPKAHSLRHSLQLKSYLRWEYQLSDQLILRIQLSDRFRTWGLTHRTELRMETCSQLKCWTFDTRVYMLKSRSHSALAYTDVTYKKSKITIHQRFGAFCVDNWDDRIYVYEYDAPGNFNVPAYYGRGVWTASMLSWKLVRSIRVYLRTSYISYPFMSDEKKKPGRAELKFQIVFRF